MRGRRRGAVGHPAEGCGQGGGHRRGPRRVLVAGAPLALALVARRCRRDRDPRRTKSAPAPGGPPNLWPESEQGRRPGRRCRSGGDPRSDGRRCGSGRPPRGRGGRPPRPAGSFRARGWRAGPTRAPYPGTGPRSRNDRGSRPSGSTGTVTTSTPSGPATTPRPRRPGAPPRRRPGGPCPGSRASRRRREVDRFGAAGGEDDLVGLRADRRRDAFARVVEQGTSLPSGSVDRQRIAETIGGREQRVAGFGQQRRRRRRVQVEVGDHRRPSVTAVELLGCRSRAPCSGGTRSRKGPGDDAAGDRPDARSRRSRRPRPAPDRTSARGSSPRPCTGRTR